MVWLRGRLARKGRKVKDGDLATIRTNKPIKPTTTTSSTCSVASGPDTEKVKLNITNTKSNSEAKTNTDKTDDTNNKSISQGGNTHRTIRTSIDTTTLDAVEAFMALTEEEDRKTKPIDERRQLRVLNKKDSRASVNSKRSRSSPSSEQRLSSADRSTRTLKTKVQDSNVDKSAGTEQAEAKEEAGAESIPTAEYSRSPKIATQNATKKAHASCEEGTLRQDTTRATTEAAKKDLSKTPKSGKPQEKAKGMTPFPFSMLSYSSEPWEYNHLSEILRTESSPSNSLAAYSYHDYRKPNITEELDFASLFGRDGVAITSFQHQPSSPATLSNLTALSAFSRCFSEENDTPTKRNDGQTQTDVDATDEFSPAVHSVNGTKQKVDHNVECGTNQEAGKRKSMVADFALTCGSEKDAGGDEAAQEQSEPILPAYESSNHTPKFKPGNVSTMTKTRSAMQAEASKAILRIAASSNEGSEANLLTKECSDVVEPTDDAVVEGVVKGDNLLAVEPAPLMRMLVGGSEDTEPRSCSPEDAAYVVVENGDGQQVNAQNGTVTTNSDSRERGQEDPNMTVAEVESSEVEPPDTASFSFSRSEDISSGRISADISSLTSIAIQSKSEADDDGLGWMMHAAIGLMKPSSRGSEIESRSSSSFLSLESSYKKTSRILDSESVSTTDDDDDDNSHQPVTLSDKYSL